MSSENRKELDERIRSNISANLNHLIERLGTTREDMADKLRVSAELMDDYCEGRKTPDYGFLLELKDRFEISIDDFISRKDTPEDIYLKQLRLREGLNTNADDFRSLFESYDPGELKRLAGNYYTYYLDTENYKGKDNNSADASINYGVLSITETTSATGKPVYDVVAMLGKKDRDRIRDLRKALDKTENAGQAINLLIDKGFEKYVYYGRILTSKDHYYLELVHENEDRISIILHRPNTRKPEYIGGIGTVNSVSRGRQHMPTVQFIGLSRKALNLSEEDIHKAMLLSYPNYHAGQESEELIKTFKNLYMNNENTGFTFNDTQRELLVQSNLERIIKESLTRNLLRYAKVSEIDDDEWYHTIKYFGIKEEH